MKKILIYGMTANRGGMESCVYNYYRFMDRDIIHFDFVSEDATIAYEEEFKQMGSRLFQIPARRENMVRHILELRKIIREGKYDAVYFHLLSASAVFSVLANWGLRAKSIVHSHNNSVKNLSTHLKLRPLLNMLTAKRVACSVTAADFMFSEKHRGDTTVINNAIDLDAYRFSPEIRAEVRSALQLSDRLTVGHVGRLCYQKNTLFLLEIFAGVLQKRPDARLLLVGEGEDRPEVEQKIADLGLEESVFLMGMREDIPQLMQAMDVFLLPSRFEGLPVVGIEAQAAGLPCVFADTFTHDTAVTDLVSFIPLETPLEEWADRVIAAAEIQRADTSAQIRAAGFDIRHEAAVLQQLLTD